MNGKIMDLDLINSPSESDEDTLTSDDEYYNDISSPSLPIQKKYYDISKLLFHILLIMILTLFNYKFYLIINLF